MVYDCFNFFNELELLEIRLGELDGLVDKFVLVESTVTFTNKPKPLYFSKNKSKFNKYLNKIIHVVVADSPNVIGNPWIIEMHQFNAITRGLSECNNNDVILLSNADEIPNKAKVRDWIDKPGKIKAFEQICAYYFLNLQAENSPWLGTRMIRYADLVTFPNPYIVRHSPTDKISPRRLAFFATWVGLTKSAKKFSLSPIRNLITPNSTRQKK